MVDKIATKINKFILKKNKMGNSNTSPNIKFFKLMPSKDSNDPVGTQFALLKNRMKGYAIESRGNRAGFELPQIKEQDKLVVAPDIIPTSILQSPPTKAALFMDSQTTLGYELEHKQYIKQITSTQFDQILLNAVKHRVKHSKGRY